MFPLQGFLYIRQLAVTVRSVVVSKKEIESVYNWQYINCLHVWVAVLADCDACLQPLIFPLIQVTIKPFVKGLSQIIIIQSNGALAV